VPVIDKAAVYRIKIRGRPPESWLDRLGGLEVAEHTSEGVILEGPLPDQAALAGVLDTLFALHLPILEVTCLQEQS